VVSLQAGVRPYDGRRKNKLHRPFKGKEHFQGEGGGDMGSDVWGHEGKGKRASA